MRFVKLPNKTLGYKKDTSWYQFVEENKSIMCGANFRVIVSVLLFDDVTILIVERLSNAFDLNPFITCNYIIGRIRFVRWQHTLEYARYELFCKISFWRFE